jgi:hypothetical protein
LPDPDGPTMASDLLPGSDGLREVLGMTLGANREDNRKSFHGYRVIRRERIEPKI